MNTDALKWQSFDKALKDLGDYLEQIEYGYHYKLWSWAPADVPKLFRANQEQGESTLLVLLPQAVTPKAWVDALATPAEDGAPHAEWLAMRDKVGMDLIRRNALRSFDPMTVFDTTRGILVPSYHFRVQKASEYYLGMYVKLVPKPSCH